MSDAAPVVIRPSAPDDAEAFHACLDAVARERRHLAMVEAPPVAGVRAFLEGLAGTPSVQRLALDGPRIVGWCDVVAQAREGFRHAGSLGMGLLPAWRGRGLGRRLLHETLAAAEASGIERVELEVYAHNRPAIRLYEQTGFQHEGVKRRARVLDGRAEDIVLMARLSPRA